MGKWMKSRFGGCYLVLMSDICYGILERLLEFHLKEVDIEVAVRGARIPAISDRWMLGLGVQRGEEATAIEWVVKGARIAAIVHTSLVAVSLGVSRRIIFESREIKSDS